jgi:hypothetical protein
MPARMADRARGPKQIARRCLVLHAVVAAGHGRPRPALVAWLRREGLWPDVSPDEAALLLRRRAPGRQRLADAQWRAEALLALLWALGKVRRMPPPTDICDVRKLLAALPPLLGVTAGWLRGVARQRAALLQIENEKIYRIHWAVRDAELNGKPVPRGYHPGVVRERHHALNWLIGYDEQEWDDVTTDT